MYERELKSINKFVKGRYTVLSKYLKSRYRGLSKCVKGRYRVLGIRA